MRGHPGRFPGPILQGARRPPVIVLPPFSQFSFGLDPNELVASVVRNPHPTDLVLDTSVFSISRLALVREILLSPTYPILLRPVLGELEDLRTRPALEPLRDLVFPGGALNSRFREDSFHVLSAYPKFVLRHVNLLRWRRDAIDREIRRQTRETGRPAPRGKARGRLIQDLVRSGVAENTIKLANRNYRADRATDEVLAVFAALSPIVTGRDCFLLTADEDVVEQTLRMLSMLFDDYGAYLIAADFRTNESRYGHRHPYQSSLFVGEAEAIGRAAYPGYLLPPRQLTKTVTTTVINVNKLRGFTWVSARNMKPAIAFQEADQLGRKGDPGGGKSILFTAFAINGNPTRVKCKEKSHFVIGTPTNLPLSNDADGLGPIPSFDIFRAILGSRKGSTGSSQIVTPYDDDQQRLDAAIERATTPKRPR